MTIIAFDGKTLAADKRAVCDGLIRTVTKIWRLKDGSLFSGSGSFPIVLEMKNWLENGGDYPQRKPDSDDMWERCINIKDGIIYLYENTQYPIIFEDRFFSCGSGRDYAIMAMHLGKTAKEAVELTCLFDNGCGNGVDVLTCDE